MDRVIRRVCGSLPFFPEFLQRVKSMNSFIRNYRGDLEKNLRESDAIGAADLVKHASLPYFAEWRWGTLHGVIRSLSQLYASLQVTMDLGPFYRRARGTKMVRDVQAAFASARFF